MLENCNLLNCELVLKTLKPYICDTKMSACSFFIFLYIFRGNTQLGQDVCLHPLSSICCPTSSTPNLICCVQADPAKVSGHVKPGGSALCEHSLVVEFYHSYPISLKPHFKYLEEEASRRT